MKKSLKDDQKTLRTVDESIKTRKKIVEKIQVRIKKNLKNFQIATFTAYFFAQFLVTAMAKFCGLQKKLLLLQVR